MVKPEQPPAERQDVDLSNSDVVTKYKAAAEICNKAIAAAVVTCKAGARIVDICSTADKLIEEECANVYKGKKMEKGIAFPTCVSVNHCVGHNCPLQEDDSTVKDGDCVKIDLGCHIDGFIAIQATTVIVQSDAAAAVTGRAGDLLAATQTCFDAAVRLIRPGKTPADVSTALARIAPVFGCTLVEGVMSHQIKHNTLDGDKVILNRLAPDQLPDDVEFEEGEVYAIDIVVSTGEGESRVLDEKDTTVFRKANDTEYSLKLKASRAVFGEVSRRFGNMPFSLRLLEQKGSRLGLVECLNHGLLHAYPVLYDKQGNLVAQLKATVLLMPNGTDRITMAPFPTYTTDKSVQDEDLKELLKQSLKTKKKKKKSSADVAAAPQLVEAASQ